MTKYIFQKYCGKMWSGFFRVQDKGQRRTFVNMVMSLRAPQNAGTSWLNERLLILQQGPWPMELDMCRCCSTQEGLLSKMKFIRYFSAHILDIQLISHPLHGSDVPKTHNSGNILQPYFKEHGERFHQQNYLERYKLESYKIVYKI